jgi:hypothetical protein
LRVGQDQLGGDVVREEVRDIDFGDHLVVDRQTQASTVTVRAVDIDGTHANHPGPFGLLRESSAGSHCAKSGQSKQFLFHGNLMCGCTGTAPVDELHRRSVA